MWRPTASVIDLKKRAQIMRKIRRFFIDKGYFEVETPLMASHGVTDVYLNNFSVETPEGIAYLQTSPEFHMKRLLAADSGPIFQLAKVFRDDEKGRLHNREFSLLEWYRPGFDHHALMQEVDDLLQFILETGPALKLTYQQAFLTATNLDPFAHSAEQLNQVLCHHGLEQVLSDEEYDSNAPYYLLMSHVVEPYFANSLAPVFIYDFPKSQAALAQCREEVASRFEVYFKGKELANGFHELTEPHEQRQRFEADNHLREQLNLPTQAIDDYFIAALQSGLPDCAGVALGVDRLCMIALEKNSISQVLSFDAHNA